LLGAAGGGLVSAMLPQLRAQEPGRRFVYSITDFSEGKSDGWLPGFADFSLATSATNRMAELRTIPGLNRTGYYLRGRNTSDDLFMFVTPSMLATAFGDFPGVVETTAAARVTELGNARIAVGGTPAA
jgi:hypothetical protein